MLLNEVKKLSPIDRLAYWIVERESVRLKKASGLPGPTGPYVISMKDLSFEEIGTTITNVKTKRESSLA